METKWNGYEISVRGNWTMRWLFLAPDYELWVGETQLDKKGGPRMNPKLEGLIEDKEGKLHHVVADIVSIIGYNPAVQVSVEGETVASGNVRVQNFINPFLVLFILLSTVVMLYVGPTVIRDLFS